MNISAHILHKCPFPTQPIREILVTQEVPGMILHRPLFKFRGAKSSVPKAYVPIEKPLKLHLHQLPISVGKYDLIYLKSFCSPDGGGGEL